MTSGVEMHDVQVAMVDYDQKLKSCENKAKDLDPKLKKALTGAIRTLDKEKEELSKRLAELENPIKIIQEGLAKSCFAAGLVGLRRTSA